MAILVKMSREGLSTGDLDQAHNGPSPGAGNIVLKTPDGEQVAGPALEESLRGAMQRWEKQALLAMKDKGVVKSEIKDTTNRYGPAQEWDTYTLSFSREESNRMSHEEMQRYAEIVVSTMASGSAAGPDKNGRVYEGTRMSYMQEMHTDTNNIHFAFGIHRHAVDFKPQLDANGFMLRDASGRCMIDPATTVSPAIKMSDESRLTKTADSVNAQLMAAGFDKLIDLKVVENNRSSSIYQDRSGPSNEDRDAAANKLKDAGVAEDQLPPSLQTGTPDHKKPNADDLANTLRSRDTDLKALDEAVRIKSMALAETMAQAEKLTGEVAAINAARVAVQDRIDAISLRDAAVSDRDAAFGERDAAVVAKTEAETVALTALEAQAVAESARDKAIEESIAKGEQLAGVQQELVDTKGELDGLRTDYDAQSEELAQVQSVAAEQTIRADGLATELSSTQEQLAAATTELGGLKTELAGEQGRSAALSTELQQVKGQLTEATTQRDLAVSTVAELRDELKAERELFKEQLVAVTAQRDQANSTVTELRDELKTERQQMTQDRQQFSDMLREIREQMKSERDEASQRASQSREEINQLRGELSEVRERLTSELASKAAPEAPVSDAPEASEAETPESGAPEAPRTTSGQQLRGDIEKLERARGLARKAGQQSDPTKDNDPNKD